MDYSILNRSGSLLAHYDKNYFRKNQSGFPTYKSKKSVTVEQTPMNKYYVSILVEYESQVPEAELKKFNSNLRTLRRVHKT